MKQGFAFLGIIVAMLIAGVTGMELQRQTNFSACRKTSNRKTY